MRETEGPGNSMGRRRSAGHLAPRAVRGMVREMVMEPGSPGVLSLYFSRDPER